VDGDDAWRRGEDRAAALALHVDDIASTLWQLQKRKQRLGPHHGQREGRSVLPRVRRAPSDRRQAAKPNR
jgi:hypothetical protein